MKRIDYLRSHLLPPGTPMRDVPPDFTGLTYGEYMELQWLEYCETRRAHPDVLSGDADLRAVRTARDNYGWRSLPSGTRLLWKGKAAS